MQKSKELVTLVKLDLQGSGVRHRVGAHAKATCAFVASFCRHCIALDDGIDGNDGSGGAGVAILDRVEEPSS